MCGRGAASPMEKAQIARWYALAAVRVEGAPATRRFRDVWRAEQGLLTPSAQRPTHWKAATQGRAGAATMPSEGNLYATRELQGRGVDWGSNPPVPLHGLAKALGAYNYHHMVTLLSNVYGPGAHAFIRFMGVLSRSLAPWRFSYGVPHARAVTSKGAAFRTGRGRGKGAIFLCFHLMEQRAHGLLVAAS